MDNFFAAIKIMGKFGSRGQTLIETLAAIFILTMGVTAALGLANYALSNSSAATKQIIATGLAREGIEAVKNMRDTNWLQGTLSTTCTGYPSGTANCYKSWDNSPNCIDPTANNGNCNGNGPASQTYYLSFDYSNTNYWSLSKTSGSGAKYGLVLTASPSHNGLYNPSSSGVTCSNNTANISAYCRKITITRITTAPYNTSDQSDVGPELYIQSQVWWQDRQCALTPDFPANGKCSIELDTYLTNWKNYQ